VKSAFLLTPILRKHNIHIRVRTVAQLSFGRYRIEAEIGRGAMGVVYRAFDPKIHRTVAIKTISLAGQEAPDEKEYRERFVQEARAAGRLSHPGIVTIFDAGEDPETHEPYLVMEYVAGKALSKILSEANGKLPLNAAVQFAQEIADALDCAHSQGVIHRDIKPANILVTKDGHAKIADFGVARLNQEVVTQTGQVVGSPAYMAPEQMMGKGADARSDLFSVGVILYNMITGFRPFQGNSAQTVCYKVMNAEPVPVTTFQHEVPPELDAIISRAIAKDPRDRYQSGAEFSRDLQKFRDGERSLAEATNFFARVVEKDLRGTSPPKSVWEPYRRIGFGAAIFSVVFASAMFGWRVSRIHTSPLPPNVIADMRPVLMHRPNPAPPVSTATQPVARKARKSKKPTQNAAPQVLESSRVQVEIQHHFNGAKASVWFDDELVFDQELRGANSRNTLLRVVEMNQITSFQFAPGKHYLQVRVVSPADTYDQIETLEAELAPGSKHVLRVKCDKKQMQVELN
jgi:serine/threonine protein kinase